MIVCVCKAVNDRAIRRAVAEGHDTFDAIQFELGVGTCCGKCVAAACEVLCEARAETADAQSLIRRQPVHGDHARPVRFFQRSTAREIALA